MTAELERLNKEVADAAIKGKLKDDEILRLLLQVLAVLQRHETLYGDK